jgi:hypothetical protein
MAVQVKGLAETVRQAKARDRKSVDRRVDREQHRCRARRCDPWAAQSPWTARRTARIKSARSISIISGDQVFTVSERATCDSSNRPRAVRAAEGRLLPWADTSPDIRMPRPGIIDHNAVTSRDAFRIS